MAFGELTGHIVITVHPGVVPGGLPTALSNVMLPDKSGKLQRGSVSPTSIGKDSFQWVLPYNEHNLNRANPFWCTRGYKVSTVFNIPKDPYPSEELQKFLVKDQAEIRKESQNMVNVLKVLEKAKKESSIAETEFQEAQIERDRAMASTMDTKKPADADVLSRHVAAHEKYKQAKAALENIQSEYGSKSSAPDLIWKGSEAVNKRKAPTENQETEQEELPETKTEQGAGEQ